MRKVKEEEFRKSLITGEPGDWEIIGETKAYKPNFEIPIFKPTKKGFWEERYVKQFTRKFDKLFEKWNLVNSGDIINLLMASEPFVEEFRQDLHKIIEEIDKNIVEFKGEKTGEIYKAIPIKEVK